MIHKTKRKMNSTQAELIFNATRWCQSKGILIYPHPLDSMGVRLKIIVEKEGNKTLGKNEYNKHNAYDKINDLYIFYYERDRK